MKQLFLIAFIILISSFAASAQETIDLQVNGVGVYAAEATVIKKLGKPLSRKKGDFPCDEGGATILRYKGLTISLIEANDGTGFIVGSINVTSANWSISNVSVGADIKDIQKRFGQSETETEMSGLKKLSYGMAEGFAYFYFRNNKLIKVYWEFNIC